MSILVCDLNPHVIAQQDSIINLQAVLSSSGLLTKATGQINM